MSNSYRYQWDQNKIAMVVVVLSTRLQEKLVVLATGEQALNWATGAEQDFSMLTP